MRSIISTAPEAIRAELRDLNVYRLIERASAYRPAKSNDLEAYVQVVRHPTPGNDQRVQRIRGPRMPVGPRLRAFCE